MHRERAVAAMLFVLACGGASRADILLEAGLRYDFTFGTLSPVGPSTGVDQAGFTAWLGASNPLDPGEAVRVELFEDNFAQAAFFSHEFNTPTTLFAATTVSATAWHDLQGGLSFTMLSGSMILDRLQARVIINHEMYEADVNLVPAPPVMGLFILGGLARRRRRGAGA
jgi:hypothetical protein